MRYFILVAAICLLGCSNETQVREAIKNNPKIVFQTIEDHPDEFVDTVNRAVKAAQEKQYERRIAEVNSSREKDLKNPRKPDLDPKRQLSGSPKGLITLVEYGDFQCPACGMAYDGLKKFKEMHKDDVRFYFKNMPLDFHKMAHPASSYYEAIFLQDPAKARKYFDYVFAHQREIQDKGFLRKAVMISGADPAQVERDRESTKVEERMASDQAEFNKMGFTGTPVVILNGVALEGAQSAEDLERALALTELKR